MALPIRNSEKHRLIRYKPKQVTNKKKHNPGIRLVKSKFNNDCAIASVAMVLRMPYFKVLKAAVKHLNFRPNSNKGINVTNLADALGYECEMNIRNENHYSERRKSRLSPSFAAIPMRGPFITSVPSVNIRNSRHAIVVQNGVVFDPSTLRRVTPAIMRKTRIHVYFDFKKTKYFVSDLEIRDSWNESLALLCAEKHAEKVEFLDSTRKSPKEGRWGYNHAYRGVSDAVDFYPNPTTTLNQGETTYKFENNLISVKNCDLGGNCPHISITDHDLINNLYVCAKCDKKFELNAGFELVEVSDAYYVVRSC